MALLFVPAPESTRKATAPSRLKKLEVTSMAISMSQKRFWNSHGVAPPCCKVGLTKSLLSAITSPITTDDIQENCWKYMDNGLLLTWFTFDNDGKRPNRISTGETHPRQFAPWKF